MVYLFLLNVVLILDADRTLSSLNIRIPDVLIPQGIYPPDETIYTLEDIKREAKSYESYQDESRTGDEAGIEDDGCPSGWKSWNDNCVTQAETVPYTVCPKDVDRFRSGLFGSMAVDFIGICYSELIYAPDIFCPPGTYLGLPAKANEKCLTMPECIKEAAALDKDAAVCLDDGNCAIPGAVPPKLVCPDGFEGFAEAKSPYSFQAIGFDRCIQRSMFKGRVHCPPGFYVHSEPFQDVLFGELVHKGASFDISSGGQYMATCLMSLSVHRSNCSKYKCNSKVIDQVLKIVKDWAYYRLETDPDVAKHYAVKSGKDLRFTPHQRHYVDT